MTIKKALKEIAASLGINDLKLVDSAKLARGVLVVLTEDTSEPIPGHGRLRCVRVTTFMGEKNRSQFIVNSDWIKS